MPQSTSTQCWPLSSICILKILFKNTPIHSLTYIAFDLIEICQFSFVTLIKLIIVFWNPLKHVKGFDNDKMASIFGKYKTYFHKNRSLLFFATFFLNLFLHKKNCLHVLYGSYLFCSKKITFCSFMISCIGRTKN